jgi:hypothetical protein
VLSVVLKERGDAIFTEFPDTSLVGDVASHCAALQHDLAKIKITYFQGQSRHQDHHMPKGVVRPCRGGHEAVGLINGPPDCSSHSALDDAVVSPLETLTPEDYKLIQKNSDVMKDLAFKVDVAKLRLKEFQDRLAKAEKSLQRQEGGAEKERELKDKVTQGKFHD